MQFLRLCTRERGGSPLLPCAPLLLQLAGTCSTKAAAREAAANWVCLGGSFVKQSISPGLSSAAGVRNKSLPFSSIKSSSSSGSGYSLF